MGEKVDSINWAREEIATCTQLLEEGREKLRGDDEEEEGPSLPTLTSEDTELGISAVDEEGNPRLKRESTSVKQAVSGIVHGATSGATKTAKVLKERVVGNKDSDYPPMNSAFVTFDRQIAAHLAVQVLAHHEPYRMSWVFFFLVSYSMDTNLFFYLGNRYIEVAPEDVIWANLGMNPYEQKVHYFCSSFLPSLDFVVIWWTGSENGSL
jgi:hypothetical protein